MTEQTTPPPPFEPPPEDWQRLLVVVAHPDDVEYGVPLRRDLAGVVRRHRPEIVMTANFRDTWGGVYLNQADHPVVGRAVVDAARDGGNRWVFPSGHVEPWNGVRAVWAAHSPESRHAVDVTETFAAGLASLRAHQAYLAGLGAGSPDPEEFLEGFLRPAGTRLGCKFAVPFEVFPLQLF